MSTLWLDSAWYLLNQRYIREDKVLSPNRSVVSYACVQNHQAYQGDAKRGNRFHLPSIPKSSANVLILQAWKASRGVCGLCGLCGLCSLCGLSLSAKVFASGWLCKVLKHKEKSWKMFNARLALTWGLWRGCAELVPWSRADMLLISLLLSATTSKQKGIQLDGYDVVSHSNSLDPLH